MSRSCRAPGGDGHSALQVGVDAGELRGQNPGLAIQACASGGGCADYGFLRYADEPSGRAVHSDAVGKTVSGAALMTQGVPFSLTGDYDSLVLVLQ